MRTRRPILRNLVLVILPALLLAACGGSGSNDGATPSPTGGQAAKKIRVAMILPGKADDFGYSQLGADTLKLIETELGAETTFAEGVTFDQQVESFRDFASQGYDLVVGWGGQFESGALQVAGEFPDVYFTVFNGEAANGSNYASSNLNLEQWEFLVGYIDGRVSKSGKVGQVVGPCFESNAFDVHGFEQGVQYAADELGKKIDVKTVALESFDDPASAKEAALALIDEGADIIHTGLNTGNLGVFQAAKARDIFVSTQFFDQSDQDPKHILTSSIQPSSKAVLTAAQMAADGTFDGNEIRVPITVEEEAVSDFNGLAPDSIHSDAKGLQAQMVAGELKVKADGNCPY